MGLRLEKIYGSPVLLSGVATLVLSGSDISTIDKQRKETYQNIQKLLPKTPPCFVYFLGGCLPSEAEIHVRMLTLFGMVAHLPNDPLNIHARNVVISAKSSSKSWFRQIRDTSLMYELPHPLVILQNPPNKETLKNLLKAKVVNY